MSNSPSRRPFSSVQKGHHEREGSAGHHLSHKFRTIDSPRLNEEQSSPIAKEDAYLKTKLQLLLKHNSQLLNQNAQLSELVNELRAEVDVRTRKQEVEIVKMNQEMGSTMTELKGQQEQHQQQLERLLVEISKLHDQCHQAEVEKTNQLRRQQEGHERELVHQIAQIRKSHEEAKNLMELQINKLKESVEMKEFEYESLKSQLRGEIEQLKGHNSLLESEIEHQRKLKDLEVNEIARRSKDDMRSALKHLELEKNVELRQYENKLLKLRKEVASKDMEIEELSKKSSGEHGQIYEQLSAIKKDKQLLLEEIEALTNFSQQKISREKERITQLSDLEKSNLQNLFQNEKEALVGQRNKLMRLCEDKSEQIKRLYTTLKQMKESGEAERREMKTIVEELRKRLKESERSGQQQIELLKIKMAQLHRSDIQNLETFYENEVSGLHKQLKVLQESSDSDRERIYQLLQSNDELRKNFEIETSKQKAQIQDMKVKFAAARLEFKEQITSLGTKMELTSQSLVRQTEQKQRGAEFFEAEKRKFYQIIETKDKQIQSIHDTMINLKALNEQQITHLNSQIHMLRDSLTQKDDELKEFKEQLQSEYQRRSMKLIQEANAVEPDKQLEAELEELKDQNNTLEEKCFRQQKDIDFLKREKQALEKELGLKAGFIESMQLESCAAIEDQKSKMKVLMGKNEVAMKDYYEMRLASREQDLAAVKKQLGEKESDLRDVISKYHHVEKKLKELLEAQDKLTDFENKIVHLGLDQNLIKNMAEMFHPKA